MAFGKEFAKALKNINASIGSDGSLPKDWISTGCLTLNKQFSGYFDRGIPVGRITTFAGPSGTGKSLITASTLREAQKAGYFPVIFDSERALDKNFLGNIGVDVDSLAYVPVSTLEEYRIKQVEMLQSIGDEKVLFLLDSFGGLSTEKELKDALEGKVASDMGLKAKAGRATFRILDKMIYDKNAALLVTNHTYTNASGYVPYDEMSAGKGLEYHSSIVSFLGKKKDKDGKEVSGLTITSTTQKNRFCPPFTQIDMELSFKNGLNKYSGLLDALEKSGTLVKNGGWYTYNDRKFQKNSFPEILKENWDDLMKFDLPTTFTNHDDTDYSIDFSSEEEEVTEE